MSIGEGVSVGLDACRRTARIVHIPRLVIVRFHGGPFPLAGPEVVRGINGRGFTAVLIGHGPELTLSSSVPRGVRVCITVLPWRVEVIKPASRSVVAC